MTNPAESYESFMVPTLFGPWASRLIQAAQPRDGERVLDLACGTGVVARRLCSLPGVGVGVTGLDASSDMLDVALATANREGHAIAWREGSAEQLPFLARSFDLVLCAFALMFFNDKSAALKEVHRVLKSDGRFYMTVWQGLDRHPFYETLHQVIQRRVGISALRDIFALGDTQTMQGLLSDAYFTRVEIESVSMTSRFPNPDAFLTGEIEVDTASIPTMQKLTPEERRALVEAIRDDMRAPLRAVTRDDHVVLEFHAHIVSAWP